VYKYNALVLLTSRKLVRNEPVSDDMSLSESIQPSQLVVMLCFRYAVFRNGQVNTLPTTLQLHLSFCHVKAELHQHFE